MRCIGVFYSKPFENFIAPHTTEYRYIAYYSIRFLRFFFEAVKRGRFVIRGFYPEWTEPTFNIIKLLIISLSAILIFPYLPASSSSSFQGVSIFIGAIFTFGSTAIIGNIISGIVLIYTRAFGTGSA